MQFRRRWNALALAAALVVPAAAFAAPIDQDTAATKFETVKGEEAVKLREDIISNAPPKTDIIGRDRYVGDLGQAFINHKLFIGSNTEGQLNAAITMAQLQTGSADKCLEEELKSPNPAVRYWAAKGLIDIAGDIRKAGGAATTKAVAALTDALGKESSYLVKRQIVGAIVALDDVDGMIEALKRIAASVQVSFQDPDNLKVILNVLAPTGGEARYSLAGLAHKATLTPEQKVQAAQAAADIASFTIQQEIAKPVDERPQNYHSSVTKVVNGSVAFLNILLGQKAFNDINGDPDFTSFEVGADFGSPGSGNGKLQTLLPGTKAPPSAATQPATAPAK